jgi:2-methylisocitrate lyase-like PEP mutase family enzyme
MPTGPTPRANWRDTLQAHAPLLLPSAHDALAARLIERAGFPAFQVGGFAMVGAMHAYPDIDLEHYGEKFDRIRAVIEATGLPVLVDGDDGYGDAKNVTRTVRGFEALGASAMFIEDQKAPKRCGHMASKEVIPARQFESKLKAALAARRSADFFIVARTDAIEPLGVHEAIERGKRYRDAGADAVYFEGPTSERELEKLARGCEGVPLATSILERGGKTPFLAPARFAEMGYRMLLYPTTLMFRLTQALQEALADLKAGRPLDPRHSVTMEAFEDVVDIQRWRAIEKDYADSRDEASRPGLVGKLQSLAGG